MNITQYRNKLKKFWVDFALWKETCYIIYKWQILMTCDRKKWDNYSISLDDGVMILREIKYTNKIWDVYKIITIILHPIRSYTRFKHYWAI